MNSILDRYFRYTSLGSSLRTETIAGLSTFAAMAYIICIQPALFSGQMTGAATGMPVRGARHDNLHRLRLRNDSDGSSVELSDRTRTGHGDEFLRHVQRHGSLRRRHPAERREIRWSGRPRWGSFWFRAYFS